MAEIAAPDVLDAIRFGSIADRASASAHLIEAVDPETLELPEPWELLVPIVPPETWAAGVTYERSRDARLDESRVEARDVYGLVYDARRPELFLKDAAGRRTVGPAAAIGIRADARWTVPEPELALVLGEGGLPIGVTIGNDVTARDIEGENPLYLPQAKIFAGACALGPAILLPEDWSEPFEIALTISGADGMTIFAASTSTERMRRTFAELAMHAALDNPIPAGTVLLTGTGIVPPDEVALQPGQRVDVSIPGIGRLSNHVVPAADLLDARSETHG